MNKKIRLNFFRLIVALVVAIMSISAAADNGRREREKLVNDAERTFENFVADPNMGWFRNHVKNAKGLFIVPTLIKAGFIFGGSGGSGVLLARVADTGEWSYPAFYTMGSVTFGLQIGGEAAEVVLMIMTKKGMDAMFSTKFQLGVDASVAAGPVGAGAQAATVDILQFARTKGIFGGLTLEGAIIAIRDSWNQDYYGQDVRPVDIVIRREVSNKQADSLRDAVASGAGR